MGLTEKLADTNIGIRNGIAMLHKNYLALNDDSSQSIMASVKAELELASNGAEKSFVFGRVKAPISASRKFSSSGKYTLDWNRIKDLVAFTIVVDGNNDKVDEIRAQLCERYEVLGIKNPFCKKIYEDYMRSSVRDDPVSRALYVYQDPTGRYYQTNDGYKNVKINIMRDGYPVEIQIKTMQQYIAHYATHDSAYKAPGYLFDGKTEDETMQQRLLISDKMFPYFEAQAYLRLYKDRLSEEEKAIVRADIKAIYERNFEIYNKYASVFNDAKADFGVHLYMLLNRQEFQAESVKQKSETLMDFSTYEVKKVFKYILKQTEKKNPSLTPHLAISRAVDTLLETPYSEFREICDVIRGEYRLPGCILAGQFDGLSQPFIKTLEKASGIFREIHIKLYDDEFAKAITGKTPIFSLEQRQFMVENCKYVSSASAITDFKSQPIERLSLDEGLEPPTGRYAIVSMTGVMDGCTPGHIKLLDHAKTLAGEEGYVYVGIKSDNYVQRVKHKETINDQDTRIEIYSGLRGVDEAYPTDNDILPSKEVLEEMKEAIADGEKCAIIVGSDWANPEKMKQKPESSLAEMKWLQEHMPEVDIVPAPPRGTQTDFKTNDGKEMSSSNLRAQFLEKQKEEANGIQNFIELRELEEES